jgi:hypothetical protein
MKALSLAIILVFLCVSSYGQITTTLWQTKKSDHFIIYYQEAPADYIDEVISKAENYYRQITEELGFTRYEGFWTWDKRAKIYLYKDKEEYQLATRQPRWSGGKVQVIARQIDTYVNREYFLDNTLPHELGHIIFREFVGYGRKLPLWLDEGVVSFLEKRYKEERLLLARAVVDKALFMNLVTLGKVNRANMTMPELFYAEAASIIEFLFKAYGKEKFLEFCRALQELRDDQNWETALFNIYRFSALAELDERWQAWLREK